VAFHGPTGNVLFQADTRRIILRPGYRVHQFLAALSSKGSIGEVALSAYLNPAQAELFRLMPASEQRHALAILRTLEEEGHSDAVLAQAALLHDVGRALLDRGQGKVGRRVRLWHRVAAVLLEAVHPTLLHRLALNSPGSWRYPFFILSHHASRGAEMAAAVGTDPLAVALIRWHHTAPEESGLDVRGQALLAALRSADEKN